MTDGWSLAAPDKSCWGLLEGDVVPAPAMRTTMSSVETLHAEYLRVMIVKCDHLPKKRQKGEW